MFLSSRLLALLAATVVPALAQNYRWTAFVGRPPQYGSADGAAANARFYLPVAVCGDAAGNVYVADSWNETIRAIAADGTVTTVAGAPGRAGSADGTPATARFYLPSGITIASGSLFVTDRGNHTIRRISTSGVSTYAGRAGESGSADGPVAAARFNNPVGITSDSAGNLYIADRGNHTIRKISADGQVSTIAGAAGVTGSTDGAGSSARFNGPGGVAIGGGGIYITDSDNHTVRRIGPDGSVVTIAGSAGASGATNGVGSAARFRSPEGIMAGSDGTLLVVDTGNSCVRLVSPTGSVTLFSGRLNVEGYQDGALTTARYFGPVGLGLMADGSIAVADTLNHSIRKIAATGDVTTLAGPGGNFGKVDGTGPAALFNYPTGVAVHESGDVYLADSRGNTIRRISPSGVVTRVAGNGTTDYVDGPAAVASVNYPMGVAVSADRHVYFCEQQLHTVRVLNPDGSIETIAGAQGTSGSADGDGASARFNFPSAIARDKDGNLYIADSSNHTIRRIPAGTRTVSTFAGSAGAVGSADANGTAARFAFPRGLSVDDMGNIYVADAGNDTIRKITPTGDVTTLAGRAGAAGTTDGSLREARFSSPSGIAVDRDGRIFVADTGNETIRRIDGQMVTTIGGTAGTFGWQDGLSASALFLRPNSVAVDAAGTLYVSDSGNNLIERGTPSPTIEIQPQSQIAPAGSNITFAVSASGPGLTYQWRLNGDVLPGATAAAYTVTNLQAATAGTYTVAVSNSTGTAVSSAATVTIGTAVDAARITNLAIRSSAGSGADMLIVGVTIGGAGTSGAKALLVRAIGPSLAAFGVARPMADPALTIFSGAKAIAANDNWAGDANVASVSGRVGAFALTDPRSLDAAIYHPALPSGGYSVQIAAGAAATGTVLAEIYDATPAEAFGASTPRLTNVSARTPVGGGNVLIAGFTVTGTGEKRILIRGIGPALSQFGVSGALADPKLELYVGSTKINENDNWSGDEVASAAASVGAFGLSVGAKDAAIVVRLNAGSYTAQISGVSDASGVALVEIYELP